MRGLCAEGIFVLSATLSTCFCWIEGAWGEAVVVAMSFCSPFEQIVKKLNFCSMRYYLATLFRWNNSQNYLWYSVEMNPQRNNDTTGSRLINNMASSTYMVGPREHHKHPVGKHHIIPHP
jgi:hypothetical protein